MYFFLSATEFSELSPQKPTNNNNVCTNTWNLNVTALAFTTLLANSADDKLTVFFLFLPENRIWHFVQIVSIRDNLHVMSKPGFLEKEEKYFNMLSAEIFTQNAKR